MSHLPPQKCWTCAKPMVGGLQVNSHTQCPVCAFHSCGDCCVKHARKAHPVWFMANFIPAFFNHRLENRKKGIVVNYPDAKPAQVIAFPARAFKQTSR